MKSHRACLMISFAGNSLLANFLAPSVLNLEVTTGSHSAFRAPHITLRDP